MAAPRIKCEFAERLPACSHSRSRLASYLTGTAATTRTALALPDCCREVARLVNRLVWPHQARALLRES